MFRTCRPVLVLGCVLSIGACKSDAQFSNSLPAYVGNVDDGPIPTTPTDTSTQAECVPEAPVTLYVSPDDSNSMASPVLAREAVLHEWGPLTSVPLRTWEFLNYYDFAYPPADAGALAVNLDLVHDGDGQYTLQIGVAAPPADREAMNLALVIDDSGSMGGEPLARAADVGRAIARELRSGDVISLVTWSDTQSVALEAHEVDGPGDERLMQELDKLAPGGSTNLSAGLAAGYDLLQQNFSPDQINRLILISDGGANVGETDADVIGEAAGAEDEAGIYLVGVGVGDPYGYRDEMLDQVTDLGKGASVFIPSTEEANEMFGDRFASTVGVAARDVQIRLDLPPGFEIVRTTAEEVSTNPEEVRPQHVAPGDTMVLHQTLASACGEAPADAMFGVTVTWLDPISFAPHEASVVSTVGDLLAQDHALLSKGAAIVAYVDALRTARQLGTTTVDVTPADAQVVVAEALAAQPGDPDLEEIEAVLSVL